MIKIKVKTKDIKGEAIQFDGDNTNELIELVGERFVVMPSGIPDIKPKVYFLSNKTRHELSIGDYVIKLDGSWMVTNNNIFDKVFETVGGDSDERV